MFVIQDSNKISDLFFQCTIGFWVPKGWGKCGTLGIPCDLDKKNMAQQFFLGGFSCGPCDHILISAILKLVGMFLKDKITYRFAEFERARFCP